jgi:hypothetical protein
MEMNKKIFLGTAFFILLVLSFVQVSAVAIKDVTSNPEQVAPGETSDISIKIENIFDYTIYNLNVKLDLTTVPFAPYQSSSEKFIDEIDDGDKENFNFELITLPSASTGIYKIPVNITYETENGSIISKQELISITVNSIPKISLSADNAETLIKGTENSLPIKIINSGLSDVKFLYVSLADSGGVRVLSSKEQYMGDISSDDFDTATFSIYVSPTSLNSVSIPVTLTYLDSTNKEYTEIKEITIKTYSLEEAENLGLKAKPNYSLYMIIGIILIAYIIYRILKKRRLKKQRN